MKPRRDLMLAGLFVLVVVGLLGVVFAVGDKPQLGLDLQGGISATLQPQDPRVPTSSVEQARQIISNRIDALGVAEPDIVRQGRTILVQLPGVKDPNKARAVIGRTAKMEFRPVVANPWSAANPLKGKPAGSSTTTPPNTHDVAVQRAQQYGNDDVTVATQACSAKKPAGVPALQSGQILLPGKIDRTSATIPCYLMGPVGIQGQALSSATAQLEQSGQWDINVQVKASKQGQADNLMNACFNGAANCPTKAMGIVLDGQVLSAPTVNAANLASGANGFVIQGQFTQSSANELALELRYGALPVTFKQATFQKVSATLGKDSLHAGLIAGAVGLALVAIYMIVMYRILGVVAIGSLATATGLLWVVISLFAAAQNLVLTLAGITGIIVSIGVAVDSNVVFYEHLREDLDKGRSLRSTFNQSFKGAWRVIVAADAVSLVGAVILWWFTVGSVRGFAFYLGLATLLDLIASWFFMRPMVRAICGTKWFQDRPEWLGLRPHRVRAPAPPPLEPTPVGAEAR